MNKITKVPNHILWELVIKMLPALKSLAGLEVIKVFNDDEIEKLKNAVAASDAEMIDGPGFSADAYREKRQQECNELQYANKEKLVSEVSSFTEWSTGQKAWLRSQPVGELKSMILNFWDLDKK